MPSNAAFPLHCLWNCNQPWDQGVKPEDRCQQPSQFNIKRPQTSSLTICAEHLVAFLFMYGPATVEHIHEHSSIYIKRMRGKCAP